MEEIHNTYRHFDWYTDFIIEYARSGFSSGMVPSPIVNAFRWVDTRKGGEYWYPIDSELRNRNLTLDREQTTIFNREAKKFYTSLCEELKLTNPELFI